MTIPAEVRVSRRRKGTKRGNSSEFQLQLALDGLNTCRLNDGTPDKKIMLAISLMRIGAKGKPFYRLVVKEKRSKRDGKYLENVGTYNPMLNPAEVNLKHERIQYWISVGAQPTETVKSLIKHNPVQTEEEREATLTGQAEKKAAAEAEKAAAKQAAAAEKLEAERVAAAKATVDAAAQVAEAEVAPETPTEEAPAEVAETKE